MRSAPSARRTRRRVPRRAAARGAVDAPSAATFVALAAHPRRRPLCLFNDGATALRCVAAARSDGAAADLPLARLGLGLARASAALLAIRGTVTTLAKVAAHADVEGNRVADALAEIGAEHRDDVLDVPAALYGTVPSAVVDRGAGPPGNASGGRRTESSEPPRSRATRAGIKSSSNRK